MFTFPHANGQQIPDEVFLAGWWVWFERFGPALDPATAAMPRGNVGRGLAAQLAEGRRFSLDVLCRMLVTPPYRNGMQATPPLMGANMHLLEAAPALTPANAQINGARLTEYARKLLGEIIANPVRTERIEALIEGDIELNVAGIQQLLAEPLTEPCETRDGPAPTDPIENRGDLVRRLVDWIDTEPHQPMYRGRDFGEPLSGWAQRLQGYFWPKPSVHLDATRERLAPLLRTAAELAETAGRWTDAERKRAAVFAEEVFVWGGVPQRQFPENTIELVFRSALTGQELDGALMNSGWTKVAAFATAHLSDDGQLVIWDSRVAHSLIRRMDALLVASGHEEIPPYLADIGRVAGRGGTRHEVNYALRWPDGYRRWPSVFAGSALVREIRDELNRKRPSDGIKWTARMVEMVLFMDGY